jgi:hypothetical protein
MSFTSLIDMACSVHLGVHYASLFQVGNVRANDMIFAHAALTMAMVDSSMCHDMFDMCTCQMPHGPSLWANITTLLKGLP